MYHAPMLGNDRVRGPALGRHSDSCCPAHDPNKAPRRKRIARRITKRHDQRAAARAIAAAR